MDDGIPEGEGIEITCECTWRCEAPRSLKGGLTNCPSCQKAVTVPGGPEGLFWLLLSMGVIVVIGLSALLAMAGGVVAGVITFLVGATVIAVVLMAS